MQVLKKKLEKVEENMMKELISKYAKTLNNKIHDMNQFRKTKVTFSP